MNRRSSLLLAIALLLVIGLAWTLSRVLSDPVPASVARAEENAHPAAQPETAARAQLARGDESELAATKVAPAPERSVPEVAPEPALDASSNSGLQGAVWVEGQILFPPETPADEELYVIARGRTFEHRPLHRVKVDGDGAFRVAFSKRTTVGRLTIDAKYLYLDKLPRLKLKEYKRGKGEAIELEPAVGGRIEGRVLPPPGTELALAVGDAGAGEADATIEINLRSYERTGGGRNSGPPQKTVVDAEGNFHFAALPADLEYRLRVESEHFAPHDSHELKLEAGRIEQLDIELRPGASLSGHVIDGRGEPVVGAKVQCWGSSRSRKVETDEEGVFELTGLGAGDQNLRVEHDDFLEHRSEVEGLAGGDRRSGLTLTLESGNFVAGRVQWPDGTPAGGAQLVLEDDSQKRDWRWQPSAESEAEADGTFRISGLERGPYTIWASARPSHQIAAQTKEAREATQDTDDDEGGALAEAMTEVAEGGLSAARQRRKQAPVWRGSVRDVYPGNSALVIVLEAGDGLRGRVVDDTGEAITRFRVKATPAKLARMAPWRRKADEQVRKNFKSDDGSFELGGLTDGAWEIEVSAHGHADSASRRVEVPQESALEMRLDRLALLRGSVIDPGGAPVAGARVHAKLLSETRNDYPWADDDRSVKTDERGHFELKKIPPGPIELSATARGFARSESQLVEIGPSAEQAGLSLALRVGARLTGELHAAAGNPDRRKVQVRGTTTRLSRSLTTDRQGNFELDDLEPDTYSVTLQPEPRKEAQPGQEAWLVEASLRRTTTCELTSGNTVHVVLGTPPERVIRLFGVITRGGEPVPDLRVRAYPLTDGYNRNQSFGKTDSEGRYEVEVYEPGRYSMYLGKGWGSGITRTVTVPEAGESEHDFDLPVAKLTGRVTGPSGEAVRGCVIQVETESVFDEDGERVGKQQRGGRTGDDGRYTIENLRPGTYVVTFGSRMRWDNENEDLGARILTGIEVGDEGRELDLELAPGGSVGGLVLGADGQPEPGVSIKVTDSEGRSFSNFGGVETDRAGRFEYPGLAPGRVFVEAIKGELRSERTQAQVFAGGTVELELVLGE